MIDFHAHILPEMDDGSRSVEEATQMIDHSFEQGVELLVATPHFYPWRERPEDFLKRREAAVKALLADPSKVKVGAEVAYYDGIDHSEGIERLKITDTDFLLIEMPMVTWTSRMLSALQAIENRTGLKVVLAHLDRYIRAQKKTRNINYVCEHFFIQVNADYFTNWRTRGKALKLMKENAVDFIGSDCHNLTSRPPNVGAAYQTIESKLGLTSVKAFNDKQMSYFEGGFNDEK